MPPGGIAAVAFHEREESRFDVCPVDAGMRKLGVELKLDMNSGPIKLVPGDLSRLG